MIYITGDTHGDITRFEHPAMKQLTRDDTIIVCGDFGFIWDNGKQEQKLLKKLGKKKYNICFVDGTHENFELLGAKPVMQWNGGKVHKISNNIYHLMRGQIFTIDNMTIFTMGGGESPDIDIRFEENTWSKDEIPTRDELMEGAENLEKLNCKVDFVVTHEPPANVKAFLRLKDAETVPVTGVNTYLEEMANACTYRRWFFGSMHLDKYISSSQIAIYQNVINAITGEVLIER